VREDCSDRIDKDKSKLVRDVYLPRDQSGGDGKMDNSSKDKLGAR
jgi:hypothetical protein